jgi:EAL domain-containing protein (putative c-di-GMP-specific phosphodiesterase class I)
LTAWLHPELGRISASQFIPIAEEIGIIDSISLWIMHEACKQCAQWFLTGQRFKLSINLSPRQLLQKNLHVFIQNIMDDTRMPMQYLEFELTETSPLIYSNLYVDALEKMTQLGISIALDDFGTSYSSLSHLRTLPISAIKIDRSFIQDIVDNKKDSQLVKSIIALGNNLGFSVIAEGIETKEQLQCLIKMGCKEGQGYYFYKPLSSDDLSNLILQHKLIADEIT